MANNRYAGRTRYAALLLAVLLLTAAIAVATAADHGSAKPGAKSGNSHYAAVARGRIDVEGGLLELHVPVSGGVEAVTVHAGDRVEKGQVLARLDAHVAQARVQIAQGKLSQARSQSHILADRLKAARRRAGTLRSAARAGAGSTHDADAAAGKVHDLKWQLDSARAGIDIAQGKLAIARRRLVQHRIKAPVAGRIVQVHIHAGDHVAADAGPAFELLPDRARIVRAELNQEYVGAVHKGMSAQVVLDDAGQTPLGSAHIVRVGDVFHKPTLDNDPGQNAGIRTVLCVLAFDKPSHRRIGQRVLVRILPGGSQPAHDTAKAPVKGS
ncbi:efflux RND transporter periplasmic adaptor subunit [Salinisphaera sp. RV14]|uniref:efflux RND transporter periplasmic adaptor subunit n=1 Tax=Salinisphaera sp. RV14 TaxID=3454140 RepID=UPI003F87F54A